MLETMKNLIKKELTREQLVDFVLGQEEHRWISNDQYVKAHFSDFLERLPRRVLHKVFVEKMTLLVRSTGKYACSVSSLQQNVIIIFPEVYNLLTKTYDGWAKAVLAHEVGHLYLDHAETSDDPMEAQVDADTFACDMGYLEEVESFLHEQPESIEKRVRLTFITNYYFNNN
ncbi:MAG: hypothetical protein ACJAS4_000304 [Bacteriovoracaceae bacterium]|jgi:hypothetical protein